MITVDLCKQLTKSQILVLVYMSEHGKVPDERESIVKLGFSHTAYYKAMDRLLELGVIKETTGGHYGRHYEEA